MKSPILDAFGRPIERKVMTTEVAGATLGGVRSPLTGYPADGMTPVRLASIMREADAGDPIRYLELAAFIEERDLHYVGVLGTRRRAVSQIEVTVEAASDAPEHERHAELVRGWLQRDELQNELFDILDAIGKGYSLTEVIYDHSEGQYMPRLEHRDQRWFRFDRRDMVTPLLLSPSGQELPLDPGKFIYARMQAKSGIPVRGGLARPAAWAYLFKKYTERDWQIFAQTFGQPVRVGKFATGASAEDKATLFRAVSNIAGDMAAIIPESMQIEFIESGNVGAGHTMFKERADWLDMQISKAVLGQTATTDAVTGGLGSGKEHGDVRADIKNADARTLAAVLNSDLIRVWMQLEFGPMKEFPRLKIADPEEEDLKALADAVGPMIDRGLRVSQASIRAKFRLPEPQGDEELMMPQGKSAPAAEADPANSDFKRKPDVFKRGDALSGGKTAAQSEGPSLPEKQGGSPEGRLTDRLADEAAPPMADMLAQIEAMVEAAASLEELRQMLVEAFPEVASEGLAAVLAEGLLAGNLAGRMVVEAEDE